MKAFIVFYSYTDFQGRSFRNSYSRVDSSDMITAVAEILRSFRLFSKVTDFQVTEVQTLV